MNTGNDGEYEIGDGQAALTPARRSRCSSPTTALSDGWKYAFAGANGATVTQIAPNFYRISVGHEGYVDVVTSVEAIDHGHNPRERWMICIPRPPESWWWSSSTARSAG